MLYRFLKILSLIVLLLNISLSYSQDIELGLKRLQDEINTAKNDSVKIEKLLDLSSYYHTQENNPDSMIKVSRRAASISKRNNYLNQLSKAYTSIGTAFIIENNIDSAYFYNYESYKIAERINNVELKVNSLIGLSRCSEKSNDLVNAIEYGLKAVKTAELSNKRNLIASAYYKLAYTYAQLDNDVKYKEYLDKAYKIVEDSGVEIPIDIKSGIYTSLVDYFEQKRYKNPEDEFLKDSLIYYADKGITYTKSVNSTSSLVYLLGMKGKMYFLEDNTKLAKDFYKKALLYKENINNNSLLSLYNKLAYVSLKENNIRQALIYKDSILSNIDNEPSFYKKAERYRIAYYICKTANKFDLALKYHEKMADFYDKAKEEKQIKTLNELEIKYKTQKKDTEIANQKLENQALKNKARTNYFVLGLTAMLGFGILGFLYLKKKNKTLSTELDLAKTKATLHRSQFNTHFIFNSINAIYPFLYDKSDPNKAAAYLSDLSQMIRSILDSTFDTHWSIKEETDFIKQYCSIQELKMDVLLELNINCDEKLNDVSIPSLITQTFVENCFVHGFANKKDKAIININITEQGYGVQIQITDNGEITKKTSTSHTSRSNDIVKQRILSSYPKENLPKDFLTFGKLKNGYQVTIKLPIA